MKTGDRIKELRKQNNLTQLELANKLNITDKAVSKWESNIGEPSIDLLMELSKLFDVSIDYLLTGNNREKIIVMSDLERIAYYDDPELLKAYTLPLDTYDNSGMHLADYVYKYEAKKVFVAFAKREKHFLIVNYHQRDYLTDLVKMSLMTNYYELISKNVTHPFIPLYKILISDNPEKLKKQHIPAIHTRIIDFILNSGKMNDDAWSFILDTKELSWGYGISSILQAAIKQKHPRVKEILEKVKLNNAEIENTMNSSINPSTGQSNYIVREGVLFSNKPHDDNNKPLKVLTPITEEMVKEAIKNSDYENAIELNQISRNKVSENEFYLDQISKDGSLSEKEKKKKSVVLNGYVEINSLIALDDYEIYEELIKYPASEYELANDYITKNQLKELFQLAVKMDLNKTIFNLRSNLIEKLPVALSADFSNKKIVKNRDYITSPFNENKNAVCKNCIEFKKIMIHKDLRFFEHAARTDKKNLDWALKNIIMNRPDEYKIQKILLDNGAKLHKIWREDDGWGEIVSRDAIDEVATQLLINQIKILIKEE